MSTRLFNPTDYPRVVAEHNNEAFGFVSRAWNTLSARYDEWWAYRATVNELERLTDRELEDIGILRADIRRIASGASV